MEPWLALSAGYEDDRLPDPTLDRHLVPGGALLGVTPGILLGTRLGQGGRLALSGELAYERFQNSADRSVIGAGASADARVPVGTSWLWHGAAAASYYDDSVYETARRMGGGIETGFGPAGPGWSLEAIAGIDGRRYGDLVTEDENGVPGTYTETGLGVGIGGTARAGGRVLLSGRAMRQRTDARDPLYDADYWLAQGSLRALLAPATSLLLGGLGQWRSYRSRPATEDSDWYWQVGVGLERRLAERVSLTTRYAYGRFSDPAGTSDDLHRLTVAVTLGLGRSAGRFGAPELRLPEEPMVAPLHEGDARVFRCHAPGAGQVSLVGDFNGWDPAANPLEREGGGWWRTELRLSAGTYQYAYLVDGVATAPADAELLVDDGFGGRNGLVHAEPAGL